MTSLLFVAALVCSQPTATSTDAASPRVTFERGLAAFEVGRFEEALPDFTRAHEHTGHNKILFNIAQCYRNLGRLRRAIFFFERYLDGADGRDVAEVRMVIGDLKRQLERERLARARVAPPPPPPSRVVIVSAPTTEGPPPLVERWWFWALVAAGTVAVVGGVWVGVEASQPSDTITTLDFRGL